MALKSNSDGFFSVGNDTGRKQRAVLSFRDVRVAHHLADSDLGVLWRRFSRFDFLSTFRQNNFARSAIAKLLLFCYTDLNCSVVLI